MHIGSSTMTNEYMLTASPVDTALARNCTSISPCQQDATLIRDAEITSNVVNECGRTELSGNIDVGENTENALAAGQVTQVKAGSQLTVTIHQVNADGAGPFTVSETIIIHGTWVPFEYNTDENGHSVIWIPLETAWA